MGFVPLTVPMTFTVSPNGPGFVPRRFIALLVLVLSVEALAVLGSPVSSCMRAEVVLLLLFVLTNCCCCCCCC